MRPDPSPTLRNATNVVFIVCLLAVGALVGGVLWLANGLRVMRAETHEWREAHSEAKIVGKTADEIIAMYGEPYFPPTRGPDGTRVFITYKWRVHYCVIALKDEVAVGVTFSLQ